MAIPTNIKTLLSGEVVEWARIEFKETWDPAASLKTVCAFANDLDNWGGGYIVIGVEEENGRPVYPLKGVPAEKLDKYQKDIFAKCKLIRPAYMPIIGVETYQNKNFIVIWCPGGETRPYSSPKTMEKNNKERIHYIRKSSNSVEPTDDEEKDLFNLANRVPFDDRVNHKAEISDLNITLIQNYLKEVKSSLYEKSKTGDFVEVCQDMNIVSTLPEYIKPKNVGLMFFSMEPDKFFPYTQIDVVQFPSGLGGNDIKMPVFDADNDDFTLTLYNLNYGTNYATQVKQNGTQGDTQDDTRDDTQGDTQDDTQEKIIKMIEENPRVSTSDMAKRLGIGIATVKRKIKKMPNISYVGSGYSGHWEIK
ncbi:putative DNA binding domain-containing protein [Acetatifactor sp. DFI.5.50]|nr:putative DNA binding domain-containing protein [Lacrimispora saccharolytica]MCG4783477.1 putative DNA binding domain-containing protein [Acetatifactor sp. DFI.5.50]